jgi:hypothetical protein
MPGFTPRATAAALCGFMAALLVALPQGAEAAVFTARVWWTPSVDASVAGYRVYVRPVGGSYGASVDASKPAAAADGRLAFPVGDLDVRADHVFVVTAYTAAGLESAFSNEMPLDYAAVAPFVDSDGDGLSDAAEDQNLNRLVDPGETDPNNPDTDGDGVGDARDACQGTARGAAVDVAGCACAQIACDDGNACDGVETCAAGVCQPGVPLACDDGNPCTADSCSPTLGCVHGAITGCATCTASSQCNDGNPCTTDSCDATGRCVSANNTYACSDDGNPCTLDVCAGGACTHPTRPDGTACSTGTACTTAGQCSGGTCAVAAAEVMADTDLALTVRRFILRPTSRGNIQLAARGWLDSAVPIEPDRDGVTVEVDDDAGDALYTTTVPPEEFTASSDRTRFAYAVRWRQPAPYNGLHKLRVVTLGARTEVVAVALLPVPVASSLLPQPALGITATTSGSQGATLSWTIRSGKRCATDPMTCSGSSSKRCR